jgi:hypothetical protein
VSARAQRFLRPTAILGLIVASLLTLSAQATEEMVTITHRGTNEDIRAKLEKQELPAHYPVPNNLATRLLDHPRPAVWISVGKPTLWNRVWSGMVGKRGEASVTFQVPKSSIRRPRGMGKFFFGNSQRLIEGTVKIPKNATVRLRN